MPLADQDRGRWDRDRIAEGQAIVRRRLRRNQPGPYQVQAAIAAVHSDAPTAAATDWRQIVPSTTSCSPWPRARWSPSTGPWPWPRSRGRRPPWPWSTASTWTAGTTCSTPSGADLLRRLGRPAEAAPAYEAAIARTANAAERAFLEGRLRTVLPP